MCSSSSESAHRAHTATCDGCRLTQKLQRSWRHVHIYSYRKLHFLVWLCICTGLQHNCHVMTPSAQYIRPVSHHSITFLVSTPHSAHSLHLLLSPQACECPLYWKTPLFCSAGGDRTGFVSVHKFVAMWRK